MIQQNSQQNEYSIHTRHIYTLHYACALGTTLHTSIVVHNAVATTTTMKSTKVQTLGELRMRRTTN